MEKKPEMIYIADPMCPWCWGFSPTLNEIMETYSDQFHFRYIAGGLRTGEHVKDVDSDSLEYIRDHWECAMYESNQEFDVDYVDSMTYRYDTEPSCRAVVSFRKIFPDGVFEFEKRLQRAFYTQRLNITERDSYIKIIEEMGLAPDEFGRLLESDESREELEKDFEIARSLERKILPTLFIQEDENRRYLARGFTRKDPVFKHIQEYLDHKANTVDSDDQIGVRACRIDEEDCL